MKLKIKITNRGLYWGLILTFAILYLCVGFVSTLHAITFFQLANSLWLAVLLGLSFEIGQASVLFSLLMLKTNRERFLPWALMFLLTALQITGNVFASFKHLVTSGSNDWVYWQKTILFGVQAPNAEMYQVIISYLQGALLPIVALGMIALVSQNIHLVTEGDAKPEPLPPSKDEPSQDDSDLGPVDLTNEEPDKLDNLYQETLERLRQKLLAEASVGTKETLKEKNAEKDKDSGFKVIEPSVEIPLQKTNIIETEELQDFDKISPEEKEEFEEAFQKELDNIDTSYLDEEVEQFSTPEEAKKVSDAHELAKQKSSKIEPTLNRDLTDRSFIVPTDDIDESGIGGEPTLEQEKQVSEFINKEKSINKPLGIDAEAEITKIGEELTQKQFEKSDFVISTPDAISQQKTESEFDKDFIIPEPVKKKRGRPPKELKKEVVEPKKEQELLPKEEVEVPQKPKENVPLNNEFDTLIKELDKAREDYNRSTLLVPPELRTPYLEKGVEVIDAKVVEKDEKIKKN